MNDEAKPQLPKSYEPSDDGGDVSGSQGEGEESGEGLVSADSLGTSPRSWPWNHFYRHFGFPNSKSLDAAIRAEQEAESERTRRRLADVGELGWGAGWGRYVGVNPAWITYEDLEEALRREKEQARLWNEAILGVSQSFKREFFGEVPSKKRQDPQKAVQQALNERWEAGEWYRQVARLRFAEVLTGKRSEYSDFGVFSSTLIWNLGRFQRFSETFSEFFDWPVGHDESRGYPKI